MAEYGRGSPMLMRGRLLSLVLGFIKQSWPYPVTAIGVEMAFIRFTNANPMLIADRKIPFLDRTNGIFWLVRMPGLNRSIFIQTMKMKHWITKASHNTAQQNFGKILLRLILLLCLVYAVLAIRVTILWSAKSLVTDLSPYTGQRAKKIHTLQQFSQIIFVQSLKINKPLKRA